MNNNPIYPCFLFYKFLGSSETDSKEMSLQYKFPHHNNHIDRFTMSLNDKTWLLSEKLQHHE